MHDKKWNKHSHNNTDKCTVLLSVIPLVIKWCAARWCTAETLLNRKAGYQITLLTANTYTITLDSAASSTATGGGITLLYLLTLIGT